MLLGQQYTQKSDIHSLALVIWEIISAGKVVKFHSNSRDGNGSGGGVGGRSNSEVYSAGGGGGGSHVGGGVLGSAAQASSTVSYGNVPYFECKNMQEVREKVSSAGC